MLSIMLQFYKRKLSVNELNEGETNCRTIACNVSLGKQGSRKGSIASVLSVVVVVAVVAVVAVQLPVGLQTNPCSGKVFR